MQKLPSYTDEEIIKMIRAGARDFELSSKYLFQSFKGFIPKINNKYHLSNEAIKDAYADALVKLIRHIKQGTFRGESKLSSYFYTIFQNAAVDVLRKNSSNKNAATVELEDYSSKEKDLLQVLEIKSEFQEMKVLIHKMGESCQKILMDWAYYGYNMKEIASRANLASVETARSMKYKCLKKLRSLFREQNSFTNGE